MRLTCAGVGDTKYEPDEVFYVQLLSPGFDGNLGRSQGQGTIRNDDPLIPQISISDAPPVLEGNSATTSAILTVSLSNASSQPVTVQYATSDGTGPFGATVADTTTFPSPHTR